MATIGEIAVNLVARTGGLTSGLAEGKTALQSFGNSALSVAASVGAAFGGLWTIQNALSSYLQVGDELQKLAIRTGVATEALSQLRYAADLSDVSMQQLQTSLIMLSRNVTRPTKAFVETLETMGLKLSDLAGKGGDSQLEIIADGLLRIKDESERAAAATRLFGRAGAEMLPLLADGSRGIQAMRDEAAKLGLTMSADMANAAAKFNDQMSALKNALSGFAMQVGALIVPALTQLTGILLQLDASSIRFGLSLGASALAFAAVLKIIPMLLAGFKAISTWLTTLSAQQTFLTALGGPSGLAKIAIAGAAAAAVFVTMNQATADLANSTRDLASSMEQVAKHTKAASNEVVKFTALRERNITNARRLADSERRAAEAGFAPMPETRVRITARPIGSPGGGGTQGVVDEVRRSNELLTKIEANTREGGVEVNEVSL